MSLSTTLQDFIASASKKIISFENQIKWNNADMEDHPTEFLTKFLAKRNDVYLVKIATLTTEINAAKQTLKML